MNLQTSKTVLVDLVFLILAVLIQLLLELQTALSTQVSDAMLVHGGPSVVVQLYIYDNRSCHSLWHFVWSSFLSCYSHLNCYRFYSKGTCHMLCILVYKSYKTYQSIPQVHKTSIVCKPTQAPVQTHSCNSASLCQRNSLWVC